MAIKDLLVAYDGNVGSQKALQFAVQMAKKYDASVTGVHIFRTETYESHIRRWIPEDVLERMHGAEQEAERSIEESFRMELAKYSYGGSPKWISSQGRPNILLPRLARYFDIMLLGQFTKVFQHDRQAIQPEDILLRAGKPLIVVPLDYDVRPFKEEAAVAWDGSRSAARALTDAMQILETKNKLDVLCVKTGTESELDSFLPEHNIVTHLKSHGIDAKTVELDAGSRGVGGAILDYCAKTQPDVLVTGGYGRGKFGGMLFGSSTREILENMNTPVMLSH